MNGKQRLSPHAVCLDATRANVTDKAGMLWLVVLGLFHVVMQHARSTVVDDTDGHTPCANFEERGWFHELRQCGCDTLLSCWKNCLIDVTVPLGKRHDVLDSQTLRVSHRNC